MARNTSILLGDYFENFVKEKVNSGRYNSVSEVVRTALRLFEQEEIRANSIINELKKGENSEMIEHFDSAEHLKKLHAKHLPNEL